MTCLGVLDAPPADLSAAIAGSFLWIRVDK
ncbi:hypothetical protein F4554_000537 [Actinopolymorpha rutila]|uniref:Uncharacterized protein n=1 Tax=Actinopolymorpha rutila TaxID=446787 RepID=A0A852ZE06_9ACTN|nr:hypothetical protein [Actinopolymorpha rutila]